MKWILLIIGFLLFRFPKIIIRVLQMIFENMNQPTSFQGQNSRVSPADFELNLLSLCTLVIKANGQVNQQELDFVRMRFVEMYGKERANAIFRTFNELLKGREISTQRVSLYLYSRTSYEVRLQILHFLFAIAQADGIIKESQYYKIHEISRFFRISERDFASIKAMFGQRDSQILDAYTVLEIDKSATDAQVKKAYREMAKKYHPDKVISQDEAIRKGAEEKFKQVQRAYEQIMKERGN
ncbi:TerB family tellurite resistance protein [Capnocytophaga canimorsus]|uniref:TerB family tellurite resistance protein n=1 Tax=Capnocytophaga canimorsus TaxID=28188 RepID=UPI00385BEF65